MSRDKRIIALFIFVSAVITGAAAAPYASNGIAGILSGLSQAGGLKIVFCKDTVKCVFLSIIVFFTAAFPMLFDDTALRNTAQYGSASMGSVSELTAKYADKSGAGSKILTNSVSISLDGKRHRRNLNVLVCGGSGSGKTRFYAKPNVMNADSSYIVLDPNG